MPILTVSTIALMASFLTGGLLVQRRKKVTPKPETPRISDHADRSPEAPVSTESIIIMEDQSGVIVMDSLTHIEGISPTMARELNASGILTYGELSRISANHLVDLIEPSSVSIEQAQGWISKAEYLENKVASK